MVNSAAGVRHGDGSGPATSGAFYFAHHLSEVQFGHDKRLHPRGKIGDFLIGERPGGDQS